MLVPPIMNLPEPTCVIVPAPVAPPDKVMSVAELMLRFEA